MANPTWSSRCVLVFWRARGHYTKRNVLHRLTGSRRNLHAAACKGGDDQPDPPRAWICWPELPFAHGKRTPFSILRVSRNIRRLPTSNIPSLEAENSPALSKIYRSVAG